MGESIAVTNVTFCNNEKLMVCTGSNVFNHIESTVLDWEVYQPATSYRIRCLSLLFGSSQNTHFFLMSIFKKQENAKKVTCSWKSLLYKSYVHHTHTISGARMRKFDTAMVTTSFQSKDIFNTEFGFPSSPRAGESVSSSIFSSGTV